MLFDYDDDEDDDGDVLAFSIGIVNYPCCCYCWCSIFWSLDVNNYELVVVAFNCENNNNDNN